jgi:vacuolar-type H+-ATPase subunit E/Vma4
VSDHDHDKKELIAGIGSEAEAEAERIIAEAKKDNSSRELTVDSQIERIRTAERERADAQIETLRKHDRIAAAATRRKYDLTLRRQVIEQVRALAESELTAIRDDESYRTALVGWIVEAIVGLDSTRIAISTTPAEADLVSSLVDEVVRRAQEISGRVVDVASVLPDRVGTVGVVVRDLDSSRLFDNTVATRLIRYGTEITKLIADRLFS